jgi:hypothetical protein
VSFLDVSHQAYINECFKFIFYASVLYSEESEVKGFFSKLRQLYLPSKRDDSKDSGASAQTIEEFLTSCLFFAGSLSVRSNALKALFMTIFNQAILGSKVSKSQQISGALKKVLLVHVAEFCCDNFLIIVPFFAQPLKQPMKEEMILSEE